MTVDTSAMAVLASPRRCELLRLTWLEERSAGDLHRAMPDVTPGAVSLQLKRLTNAGMLQCRPDGTYRYYRARPETLGEVGALLEQTWADALWRLKLQAELEEARRGPRPSRRPRRLPTSSRPRRRPA